MYKHFISADNIPYYLSVSTKKFHSNITKDTKTTTELKEMGGTFVSKNVYNSITNSLFKSDDTYSHFHKGVGYTKGPCVKGNENLYKDLSLIKKIKQNYTASVVLNNLKENNLNNLNTFKNIFYKKNVSKSREHNVFLVLHQYKVYYAKFYDYNKLLLYNIYNGTNKITDMKNTFYIKNCLTNKLQKCR